jgi:hypothetical protein
MDSSLDSYHDVLTVEVIGEYTLRLGFDDGTWQMIDFEPVLVGPLFGALRDPDLFAQVSVNKDTGTIEWPNGADVNPTILHDWPVYQERVIADRTERYRVKP